MSKHFMFKITYCAAGEFEFEDNHLLLASNLNEAETVAEDITKDWYGFGDEAEPDENGWYENDSIIWKLDGVQEVDESFATTAKRLGVMTLFNEGHVEVTSE